MEQISTLIADRFRLLQTAIPKPRRKEVEQELSALSQQPGFLKSLVHILLNPSQPDNVKLSCSTYVGAYVKHRLSQQSLNPITANNSVSPVSAIIEELLLILDSDAAMTYKAFVSATAFAPLFQTPQLGHEALTIIKSKYVGRLRAIMPTIISLQNQTQSQSQKFDLDNQSTIREYELLVNLGIQTVANTPKSSRAQVEKLFGETFEPVLAVAARMILEVETQAIGTLDLSKLQQRIVMMKSYCQLVKLYFEDIKFHEMPEALKYLFSKQLEEYISRGLSVSLPNNSVRQTVLVCTDSRHAMLLNAAKQSLFALLYLLLKAVWTNVPEESYRRANPFFSRVSAYLDLCVRSLAAVLRQFSLEDLEKFKCFEAVESMLELINWIVGCTAPFYECVFERRNAIFVEVLFPLMRLSNAQLASFDSDPQDFVEHMLLLMRKGARIKNGVLQQAGRGSGHDDQDQQFEDLTVQMKAAITLSSLCRYQDGFLFLCVSFCFERIQAFKEQQQKNMLGTTQLPQNTPNDNNSANTTINSSLPNLDFAELFRCLLVLGIIASDTVDRADVQFTMKRYFESQAALFRLDLTSAQFLQATHLPASFKHCLQIQRCFILLLLHRYLPHINDSIDNKFAVDFSSPLALGILNKSICKPSSEALEICALELVEQLSGLNSLAVAERSPEILALYLGLIKQYNSQTQGTHNTSSSFNIRLFEAVYDLIRENYESLAFSNQAVVLDCFRTMVSIICMKFKPSQKQPLDREAQVVFNNCWNIVRMLVEYMSMMVAVLEPEVLPLLDFLPFCEQIEFDEDIVLTVASLLKHSRLISPSVVKLVEGLPGLVAKNKGCFTNAFQFLNMVVLQAKPCNFFQQRPEILKGLIRLCVDVVNNVHSPRSANNQSDNCEGILILQNIVALYAHLITDEIWVYLLENLYKLFSTVGCFKHNFFRQHALVLLTLSFASSLTKLSSHQDIQSQLLKVLLSQAHCLKDTIPSKAYALALIKMLSQLQVPLVASTFQQLMDTCVSILRTDYNRTKTRQLLYESKMEDAEKRGIPFTDEDQDYDDDKPKDQADHQISMKTWTWTLKDVDVYQEFKDLFNGLKLTQLELLKTCMNTMGQEKRAFISKILSMVKIGDQYRPIISVNKNKV